MKRRIADFTAALFGKRGGAEQNTGPSQPPGEGHQGWRREDEIKPGQDAHVVRFWDEDVSGAAYQIVLTDVRAQDQSYRKVIDTGVLIGFSNEMDICIDYDKSVSRKHCEILREGDFFYIINHSRSNGTYLNHQVVVEKTPVASGDIIMMGRVEMRLEIDG